MSLHLIIINIVIVTIIIRTFLLFQIYSAFLLFAQFLYVPTQALVKLKKNLRKYMIMYEHLEL